MNLVYNCRPSFCSSLNMVVYFYISMRIFISKICFRPWVGCSEWNLCAYCWQLCAVQLWTWKSQVSGISTLSFFSDDLSCTAGFNFCMIIPVFCSISLYCTPASLSGSCPSMQCPSSNVMLGNVSTHPTSAGCNVSSCSYGGFVNGTITTS